MPDPEMIMCSIRITVAITKKELEKKWGKKIRSNQKISEMYINEEKKEDVKENEEKCKKKIERGRGGERAESQKVIQ